MEPKRPVNEERGVEARLVEAAHDARAEGLVVSSSGNISARVDAEAILISAARTRLGRLREEEVLRVRIASGEAEGESRTLRPSRETPMHCAVYRAFSEVGAVLHCQSLAATIFACRVDRVPDIDVIPEVPVYIRSVGSVPFLPPGSTELGAAVVDALSAPGVRLVQLGNHGQLVVGPDPAACVERAAFFELACRLALLSEGRAPLRDLDADELRLLQSY